MSFHKGLKGAAIALALTVLPVAPAIAGPLVVKASGPSSRMYPAGRALTGSTVSLKAGDILILLDSRGTRTLRGPGTFGTTATVTAAASDTRTSLASLLEGRKTRRARTGAVRGFDTGPVRSPNLWYVDISQPTVACVPDATNVQLWRPDDHEAISITAKSKTGQTAKIDFAAGTSVATWPAAALPVSSGSTYSLAWAGLTQPIDITFNVMEAKADGLENMASLLITNKCEAQLNLLVETVALPDPAADNPG